MSVFQLLYCDSRNGWSCKSRKKQKDYKRNIILHEQQHQRLLCSKLLGQCNIPRIRFENSFCYFCSTLEIHSYLHVTALKISFIYAGQIVGFFFLLVFCCTKFDSKLLNKYLRANTNPRILKLINVF